MQAPLYSLLAILSPQLDKNMTLLSQLHDGFKINNPAFVPLFPIDLTLLSATSLRKYEILESIPTCQAIDQATFELIHLDGKLTLIRNLAGDAIKSGGDVLGFYQSVHQSCKSQVPKVKEALENAKDKLERLS